MHLHPGTRAHIRRLLLTTAMVWLASSLLGCTSGPVSPNETEAQTLEAAVVALPQSTRLWSEMVVPYELHSSLSSSKRAHFEAAMSWWKAAGFVFVPYDAAKHPEWIQFRGDNGSKCAIGRQGFGKPTQCSIGGWAGDGNAAHELGHGLGLKHEQVRHAPTDRDLYIDIDWGAIMDDYEHNFTKIGTWWDENCPAKDSSCVKGTPTGGYELGGYDYGSIMHYGSHDFGEVGVGTVAKGGLVCLLKASIFWFDPACFSKVAYTKEVFHKTAAHGGGKVYANRSHLSLDDIAKVKELYTTYAFSCGSVTGNGQSSLSTPSGKLVRTSSNGCQSEAFVRTQKDYTHLQVTVRPKSRPTIPASSFRLSLITPAPGGGSDVLSATNPGGDTSRLVLQSKAALLPGPQKLVFENLTTTFVDYELTWAFTDAPLPKDMYDAMPTGNTPATAVKLGPLPKSPLLGGHLVTGLTIHETNDVDYFQVSLPSPGPLESLCGVPGAKGPGGRPIVPGGVRIQVKRQDTGRTIRTVVYRYDGSGNLIGHAGAATNTLRPWGWGTLGKTVQCPHDLFKNRPIVFSFQDCSDGVGPNGACKPAKRHFYSFQVTYAQTYEWADEELLAIAKEKLKHDLQVLPEPGPWGWMTGAQVEWIMNQGSAMLGLVAPHLGEAGEMLEELAAEGIFFEPGELSRIYDTLQSFEGEPEMHESPEAMLFHVAERTEQLRMEAEERLAMLEEGVPLFTEAELVMDDIAEPGQALQEVGISEVQIAVDVPALSAMGSTLYSEKAAAPGAGEPGTAFFFVDGELAEISFRFVDGQAVTQGDVLLDLEQALSPEEALRVLDEMEAGR